MHAAHHFLSRQSRDQANLSDLIRVDIVVLIIMSKALATLLT
jgi:hypothetical protein